MKFLCVCDGGNVRSVAMAYALKMNEQEALAVGRLYTTKETMDMLSSWADQIILMEPHMIESIDPMFHKKIIVCDVGPDRYGLYIHPELQVQVVMFMGTSGILPPPKPKEYVFGEVG